MDLQMQVKRGVIALAIWAMLGSVVLSRAGQVAVDAARHDAAPRAVQAALQVRRECDRQLRIDLTQSVRLTVPCDRSCAPIRCVADALHLPVVTLAEHCELVRTA